MEELFSLTSLRITLNYYHINIHNIECNKKYLLLCINYYKSKEYFIIFFFK